MTQFAAIRCQYCGTYRLVGDPCDCRIKLPPVIIGEGSIDDQIRYAIRCVCGDDRVILKVEQSSRVRMPKSLPDGAKHFVVTSKSATCDHDPQCKWIDEVFWYQDRAVVIKMSQISTTSLGNVLRQLRGE